jgi:hypothetical protein
LFSYAYHFHPVYFPYKGPLFAYPLQIWLVNNSLHSSPTEKIVTIIEPHYDSTLKLTFSVGTRFIKKVSRRKKRASRIEVFAFDYPNLKEYIIKIPYHKCIMYNCTKTKEDRIADYVHLLKRWAHHKMGTIPYVWGGTSFTKNTPGNFKEVTTTGHNGDYSFYEYEKDIQTPKNGFDCSGVILRAAQICGIPYFCKNTTTIAQCLKTYKDLCDAYFEKKVIKRKDKKGIIRDTFSNVQLFPMVSAWK